GRADHGRAGARRAADPERARAVRGDHQGARPARGGSDGEARLLRGLRFPGRERGGPLPGQDPERPQSAAAAGAVGHAGVRRHRSRQDRLAGGPGRAPAGRERCGPRRPFGGEPGAAPGGDRHMSTPQPPIVRGGGSLQVQGQALLIGMHAAAQALKLYPVENAAVQKALDELHRTVMRVIEREGTLELKLIGDFVFLNDARLRLDLSNYTAVSFFGNARARHGVGRVTVDPAVSRNEWAPFLSLLLQDPPESADPSERFTARLANTPVSRITVSPTRALDQRPG